MTDLTLKLRIDADGKAAIVGIKGVEDKVKDVGRAADTAKPKLQSFANIPGFKALSGQLSDVKSQLLGLVGAGSLALLVSGGIQAADSFGLMSSRLKLAVGDVTQLANAQKQVVDIARATRAPLQETNTLFARLVQTAKSSGDSTVAALGKANQLTTAINQALALSGSNTQQSAAAIQQLIQGLQSGVLRGDEFNSVMENGNRVAQALADGLGVPIGALRQLAEEGKLTADVVTKALSGQAEKIAAEFATLPVTVSAAFVALQNGVTVYLGTANQAGGYTQALANAILLLADNVGAVIELMLRVGATVAVWYTLTAAVTVAKTAMDAYTASVIRAELGMVGLGASSVSAAAGVTTLAGASGVLIAAFAGWQIGSYLSSQFVEVRIAGAVMIGALLQGWEQLRFGATVAWEGVRMAGRLAIDGVISGIGDLLLAMVKINEGVLATPLLGKFLALGPLDEATAKLRSIGQSLRDLAIGGDVIRDEYDAAMRSATDAVNQNTRAIDANIEGLVEAYIAEDQAATAKRDLALAALDATGALGGMATGLADVGEKAQGAKTDLERLAEAASSTVMRDIDAALTRQLNGQIDVIKRVGNARAEDISQALAGTEAVEKATTQAATEYQRSWMSATESVSDAFGDFVAGGLKDWGKFGDGLKSIAKRFIADLVSQFARDKIFGPLLGMLSGGANGFSGSGGGILSSLATLFGGGGGRSAATVGGPFAGATASGSAGLGQLGQLLGAGGGQGTLILAAAALQSFLGGRIASALGGNERGAQIGGFLGGIPGAIIGGAFGGSRRAVSGGQSFDFGSGTGNNFTNFEQQRSFYRGTRRTSENSALDGDAARALAEFVAGANAALASEARLLGRDTLGLIQSSFRREIDAKGNVTKEVGTLMGVQYVESLEIFQQRVIAESRLAQLPELAQQLAAGSRGTVEALTAMVDALVMAQADINSGNGLLGDAGLEPTIALIERLKGPNESLSQTYVRLSQSVQLLESSMLGAGLAIGKSREAFVELSAGVVEALGGFDAARQALARFQDGFYSAEERATLALSNATAARDAALAAIGVQAGTTATEFRALFEAIRGTLTGEQIAQWIRAGNTILDLTDAEAALAETRRGMAEQLRSLTDSMAEDEARLFDARSETQRELDGITRTEQDRIRSIQEYVDAGGDEVEAARLLARAHAIAAADIARVTNAVFANARALAGQLGYTLAPRSTIAQLGYTTSPASPRPIGGISAPPPPLGGLNAAPVGSVAALGALVGEVSEAAALEVGAVVQESLAAIAAPADASAASVERLVTAIDSLGASGGRARPGVTPIQQQFIERAMRQFGTGFNAVFGPGGALEGAFNEILSNLQEVTDTTGLGIREWLANLDGGEFSQLTGQEQLDRANAELSDAVAAAARGDEQARSRLTGLADNVLRLTRAQQASGEDFNAEVRRVRALLEPFVNQDNSAANADAVTAALQQLSDQFQAFFSGQGGPSAQEIGAAVAEAITPIATGTNERFELANRLLADIIERSRELGISFADSLALLGIPIAQFAADLGIDVNNLSDAMLQQLATLANLVGQDLDDLGRTLGIEVGSLRDAQSLASRAFELTLGRLPAGLSAQLLEGLSQVRLAVTDEGANAALASLAAVINLLPEAQRNLLAPFLDGVLTGVGALLEPLTRPTDPGAPPTTPGFAVGTSYVPRDMNANIHQGEIIMDPQSSEVLRRYGIGVRVDDATARRAAATQKTRDVRDGSMDRFTSAVELSTRQAAQSAAAASVEVGRRIERGLQQLADRQGAGRSVRYAD